MKPKAHKIFTGVGAQLNTTYDKIKKEGKMVRETKDEKLDKSMTIKQKTKLPLKKFHLTAIMERSISYFDRKTGDTIFFL